MRILFVCLGNICRSPLAEGIFVQKIEKMELKHLFDADSCGTGSYHIGQLPDPRTRKNASANGVELTHRCRQVKPEDLESFDLIIPMDSNNKRNLLALSGAEKHLDKIILMRRFDDNYPDEDVPDPYHGQEEDFQEVFEILERSVAGLIRHLTRQA